jgi:hypothetical protein
MLGANIYSPDVASDDDADITDDQENDDDRNYAMETPAPLVYTHRRVPSKLDDLQTEELNNAIKRGEME